MQGEARTGVETIQDIPEIQPAPPAVLTNGAHFDVDEGQHGQRGDDLKDHCRDPMGLPHKVCQGQACLLILHPSQALSHSATLAPDVMSLTSCAKDRLVS